MQEKIEQMSEEMAQLDMDLEENQGSLLTVYGNLKKECWYSNRGIEFSIFHIKFIITKNWDVHILISCCYIRILGALWS